VGSDLGIPEARQQWVVSAYSLPFTCFLLLISRIADIYGKKPMFILGSVGVCLFLVVTPFAPNEISLDVFRGLQGLSAAASVPSAIGILGATFPPGKAKNYAISLYSSGYPLGSVIGNLLGGVVGGYLNWKWVLWVQAILAALITVAGVFVIPTVKPATNTTGSRLRYLVSELDWLGAALITLGLLALMFALTEGNLVGWSRPYIPVLIVLAAILIALFITWQHYLETRTTRTPLLKMSIWRNKRFASAQLIQAFSLGSFSSFLVYATFFYQNSQHLSVLATTLRFIPTGVVGLVTALLSSYLLGRFPGQYILIFGSASVTLACMLFALPIPPSTTYWAYGLEAMALSVFGADTLYPCVTLFTVQSLPPQDQAMGGGIVTATGQLGRMVVLALATAVESSVRRSRVNAQASAAAAQLESYRAAQWFNCAVAAVSMLFAILMFRGAGVVGVRK